MRRVALTDTYAIKPDDPGPAPGLDPSQGAVAVPDRPTFEALARRDDVPGALAAREMKILIIGVDTPAPTLYFLNTNTFPFHYDFADQALHIGIGLAEFNARTYFRDDRSNLAGTIVAHDQVETPGNPRGVYALEFWPTDPVRAPHVALAFNAIRAAMPFAAAQLAYHPAGDTQEALFREDEARLRELGVRSVSTAELFANVSYVALNLGEGYGVLSAFDPSTARPPTVRDIALFTTLPNDLGHVAGVISATPQTPLSHINLKAKQNDTPNAYVREAATDPRIAEQVGKVVRYAVTPDASELDPATPEEVEAWLERIRPREPQTPPRDLSVTRILPLGEVRFPSVNVVGAKAANVGELRTMLPAGVVPDGYAIPFSFYDRFMAENGFYDAAAAVAAEPDPILRDERLSDLRKQIRRGALAPDLAEAIAAMHASFPADTPIRCRSSTNNEDLKGFNGAGLYDSNTHRPDEGDLAETVRQVWASLWTLRGVDEREFHRIDHLAAAMGVLVHPNFDDELANGVAVTKNPFDPNWPGFYVNVQVGESLVTNPDPNATPDELLVSRIGPQGEYETQYIRRSSLVPAGQTVMTKEQVAGLTRLLATVQQRFRVLYDAVEDPTFAMDVEFKVDADGGLVVKQARPWVD